MIIIIILNYNIYVKFIIFIKILQEINLMKEQYCNNKI
jgi:hypothetical protein